MSPGNDLKRSRNQKSEGDNEDSKKVRRSARISGQHDKRDDVTFKNSQLPSPVTRNDSKESEDFKPESKEVTVEPPDGRPSQIRHRTPPNSNPEENTGLSSPPFDTQPFTQTQAPHKAFSYEVEDEEGEGVWGYLLPLDANGGEPLVLRLRAACPVPKTRPMKQDGNQQVAKDEYRKQEEAFEETKINGKVASGYLIGRHPECDRIINLATISNRHCLIYQENKGGDSYAVLEDLSGNGTFINEAYVGRNKRRDLQDGDEIAILDEARFIFRYPRTRGSHGFKQQYTIQQQLGKGHFASVYLCVEKCSGMRFAVKKFEKRTGPGERSRVEGLQQEIAVLMGVSHPNVLCLKDTFDDPDGVYLVLELAQEGELFNWIVMKSKLTESDTRKLFIQLFMGVKYLHERNIVHRDIKPENILLLDKELSVKIADFGLAKIIGEESFTTTLCGTPSYVAPEILEPSNHRRYTRAVDVWSLGVVLYICLCGFPPFSDELYSAENPYTLSDQIKLGRFDYPSPYWDPVSDLALDLIDRMLTVEVNQRITIDQCLEHPWITNSSGNGDAATVAPEHIHMRSTDSSDSLTGAMSHLDFSKRKVQRERTLLSTLNTVRIAKEVPLYPHDPKKNEAVKVYEKNKPSMMKAKGLPVESRPADGRKEEEFMKMGGNGDQALFGPDGKSVYEPGQMPQSAK